MKKNSTASFFEKIFSNRETAEKLASKSTIRRYSTEDVIYIPGDPADEIYFIIKGIISLLRVTPNGRGIFLDFVEENRFFGDEILLEKTTGRMELAEVKKEVQLAVISATDFRQMAFNDTVVARFLIEYTANQTRNLTDRLEILLHREVRVRLAALLLDLAKTHGVRTKNGILLNLNIPHHELARFIGATRETVSATISSFKASGAITSDGRRLVISDYDALECLV